MKKRQRIRKTTIIGMFLLFPIIIFYFSPYLIIAGAFEGVVAGCVIMFALQFAFSLIWGRSLCGYICPVGGLQECMMLANDKKAKGGKRNLIKYFIWAPWILAAVVLFIRAGGVNEVDFFFHINNGFSISQPFTYAIYYCVILIVVIMSLTMGKRAFCHYICWMAPFMVIGTKLSDFLRLPRLRLYSSRSNCIGCGRCSWKCPMSLDVREMVENENIKNSECILCGECVDVCPQKAIAYSFKAPGGDKSFT